MTSAQPDRPSAAAFPGGRLTLDSAFPTVAELLELPELEGATLLTRQAPAALRRVRRTSVQELPLDDFVRPEELVMTTGMGLGDDPDRVLEFVREIARAGAAALAIAVGPHVSSVPQLAVLEADRLGLPLLEFPWEKRFSEVTELVLDRVVARQQAWLTRSEKVHELFTRIVLSGGDLPQLARFLELQIGRPVRIVDRWGDASEAGPDSLAGANPGGWGPKAARIPITAEHKDLGSILVLTGDGALHPLDAMVVKHAATAAALIMLMERAAAEGEARGQSELLVAVLNGTSGSPRDLERRALALGLDPRSPCAVVHVSVGHPSGEQDGSALADVARWAVDRAMSARRANGLQAWDGPDVTLMLPDPLARSEARVRALLDEIAGFVHRQDPTMTVSCGIGSVSPTLGDVRESFREAVAACRLGTALRGAGSVTEYATLGPYPALYEALQADGSGTALASLQQRYLGAVAHYEQESGLPLLETLTVYFEERCNQSATARSLRINRQSLLYRLERFEAISGVELASPVDRFGLELALLCRRMRNGTLGEALRDAVVA